MFKSKENKVDKLIKKLHEETTREMLSIRPEYFCGSSIKGYTCTRLKNHSGYHVASAPVFFQWYGLVCYLILKKIKNKINILNCPLTKSQKCGIIYISRTERILVWYHQEVSQKWIYRLTQQSKNPAERQTCGLSRRVLRRKRKSLYS